jgi:hypothetical protein
MVIIATFAKWNSQSCCDPEIWYQLAPFVWQSGHWLPQLTPAAIIASQ